MTPFFDGLTIEEAVTDPLTGLIAGPAARRLLDRRIADTVKRHTLYTVVDLDGLKAANDGLGHQFGDQLLAAAGRIILEHTRTKWDGFRVGGDEFTMLHNAPPDAAPAIEARLRRAFDGRNGVSASVGTGSTEAEADARMYLHKASKRRAA